MRTFCKTNFIAVHNSHYVVHTVLTSSFFFSPPSWHFQLENKLSCEVPDRKRVGYRGILCLESFPVELIEFIQISKACALSERKKKDQASLFSVLFFWAGWLIRASFEIKMHTEITRDFSHSWREDLCGRLYTSSVVAYDESLDV